MFDNWDKALQLSTEALNSEGAAMEKYNVYMQSVEASQNRLKASIESFVSNIHLEEFIIGINDILTKLVDLLNNEVVISIVKLITPIALFGGGLTAAGKAATNFGKAAETIADKGSGLLSFFAGIASKSTKVASVMGALGKALPVVGGVLSVVSLAAMAWDYFADKSKKADEELQNLKKDIEENQTKLDGYNSELETTKKRIEELEILRTNHGLLPDQIDELESLKEKNAELERNIELTKTQLELDKNKEISANLDKLDEYGGASGAMAKLVGTGTDSEFDIGFVQQYKNSLAAIPSLQKKLAEALKSDDEIAISGAKALIERNSTLATESLKKMLEMEETIKAVLPSLPDELKGPWQEVLDIIADATSTTSQKVTKIWESTDMEPAREALETFAESSEITGENIEDLYDEIVEEANGAYGELEGGTTEYQKSVMSLIQQLRGLGLSYDDIAAFLREVLGLTNESTNAFDKQKVALQNIETVVDNIKPKADVYNKALEEMNKYGYINADTAKDLEKSFGNLDGKLIATRNGFKLTTGSMEELYEAAFAQYKLDLSNAKKAAQSVMTAEQNKQVEIDQTTESYLKQLNARKGMLRAELLDFEKQMGMTYSDAMQNPAEKAIWDERFDTYRKAIGEINDIIDDITNAQTNLNNAEAAWVEYGDKSGSGSGSTKYESPYEKQVNDLENLINLSEAYRESIEDEPEKSDNYLNALQNEINYYTQLQDLAHDRAEQLRDIERAGGTLTAEQAQELRELTEKWWEYKAAIDEAQKLIKEYPINIYNKQLEKSKDLLSDLKDVIGDLIDARRQQLEEEQRTWDKNSTIFDSMADATEKYHDSINELREDMRGLETELEKSYASPAYLDESLRDSIFNEKDYKKLSQELKTISGNIETIYNDYITAISSLDEFNIYQIEEITAEYERQLSIEQKKYAIAEAEVELAKRKKELEQVKENRNVRMWNGKEWVWTYDTEAYQDALQDVSDAEAKVESAEKDIEQERIVNQLKQQADAFDLMSQAAEATMEEIERNWEKIETQLNLETKTLNDVLKEINNSDVPLLREVLNSVGQDFISLVAKLGSTDKLSRIPFGNDVFDKEYGWITKQYLQNKVDYEEAMKSGDVIRAKQLAAENEQIRLANEIYEDRISSADAKEMLQLFKYQEESMNDIGYINNEGFDNLKGVLENIYASNDGIIPKVLREAVEKILAGMDDLELGKPVSSGGWLTSGGTIPGGATTSKPSGGSGSSSGSGMSARDEQAYWENKKKYNEAKDRGDAAGMAAANAANQAIRDKYNIKEDLYDVDKNGNIVPGYGTKTYDTGGVLKGMGGIKATKNDEVIFDEHISAKMLDPQHSREFLNIADGLTKILDMSSPLSAILRTFARGQIDGNTTSMVDSHDIYLPEGFMSSMTKQDSDTISSIFRRYIPITR